MLTSLGFFVASNGKNVQKIDKDRKTKEVAVIKLIEKKDRDKRYMKNWRPISLLNVDTKITSKTLAAKLKKFFRQ